MKTRNSIVSASAGTAFQYCERERLSPPLRVPVLELNMYAGCV